MHLSRALWLALTIVLAASGAFAQKGGKPQPADQPATASFRCAGFDPCGSPGFVVQDSITGDGNVYVGVGNTLSGSGAFLRSDGELALDLRSGGTRLIYLNFAVQAAAPSGGFFRKTFTQATLASFHLNTNVINPATGQEASGALLAIPDGETWPSRIRAFWTDPYGVEYTIRFNPDDYPGSTYVWITRESPNTWTVEAGYADVARLVSTPPNPKGKPGSLTADEGLYVMPFKVTFTVP